MTYAGALHHGKQLLLEAGVHDPEDAWYLMEHICKIDKGYYYLHCQEQMGDEAFQEYEQVLEKRMERMPLQYITGSQEFMGLRFLVTPDVLIPRQDTETLVEEVLKEIKPGMEALDLCTGSGCIMISLKKRAGVAFSGTASDISRHALSVAEENARFHAVDVAFVQSDLFQGISGEFDLIVSNPPYIPTEVIGTLMPEVMGFEPLEALDGKEDGLSFYREILRQAGRHLKPGGQVFFEIGHDQGAQILSLFKAHGFVDRKVVKDLAGNDRVACGKFPG